MTWSDSLVSMDCLASHKLIYQTSRGLSEMAALEESLKCFKINSMGRVLGQIFTTKLLNMERVKLMLSISSHGYTLKIAGCLSSTNCALLLKLSKSLNIITITIN